MNPLYTYISYAIIVFSILYFLVSYLRKDTRSQTVDVANTMRDAMVQTTKNFLSLKAFATYILLFILILSILYLVNNYFLHIV
jgi:hypothetical protein